MRAPRWALVMLLTTTVLLVEFAASAASTSSVLAPPQPSPALLSRLPPPLVLLASCSVAGNCSATLAALLDSCRGGSGASAAACVVELQPSEAIFRLEQRAALRVAGVRALAVRGHGAQLVFDRPVPFLDLANCSGVEISNLTLGSQRPPYTLGVVQPAGGPAAAAVAAGRVLLRIDKGRYPLTEAWTRQVAAMHEVELGGSPKIMGLDWIYSGTPSDRISLTPHGGGSGGRDRLSELVDPDESLNGNVAQLASFQDRPGFDLVPGTALVLRHMLEFSEPGWDSIVLRSCTNVLISDVTINNSPGTALIAWDSAAVAWMIPISNAPTDTHCVSVLQEWVCWPTTARMCGFSACGTSLQTQTKSLRVGRTIQAERCCNTAGYIRRAGRWQGMLTRFIWPPAAARWWCRIASQSDKATTD